MCNIVEMFHLFYCLQCWNDELAMMRRYHSSQRRNLEDSPLRGAEVGLSTRRVLYISVIITFRKPYFLMFLF